MHRANSPGSASYGSWAAVLVVALLASPALGQEPGAAPPIVPPRAEVTPEVAYPALAEGDAEVVLKLLVAADGSVSDVEVERGAEPFASAAREAARGFRFAPATRGGTQVAARIRFAVTFRAPPVEEHVLAADAYAGDADAPPEPEAPPPKPLEVVVFAQRPLPRAQSMSRAEVRQLPGAFGDPFRAVEALPGVTPIVSGLPYFYVRGAPPGNVGYYLDGVRVPYLFHAAAGPSVIHPGLVDRVELHPGGYPARFGRFSGAIISAETTPPSPDLHGEGNIRLVDVGGLVEGTFADGRGSALVAGRYSYTSAVFSLLSPDIGLDYRDYQARVSYAITPTDRVTVFAFGSFDLLTQSKNDIDTVLFGSEFYRVDARYDVMLPGEGRLRWATTYGFDQTRVADQRNARDTLWSTRVELTQPVSGDLTVRGGLDVTFDDLQADPATYGDPDDPDVAAYNRLFPPRVDSVASAWVDAVWRPAPRLEVTPGARVDLFHSGGATAAGVDPRLAVRVEASKRLRLLHAVGMAHQPPSFILPVPGLAIGNLRGGLQRTVQASAGFEVDLPAKVTGSVTGFTSVFLNMSDTAGVRPPGDQQNQVPRSLGVSRGLEVHVRRNLTTRLGGYLSYTLSRSTRSLGNITFPFAFDRTHVLNAALASALGRGWRAGGRFTYYTGAPNYDVPSGATDSFRPVAPTREPAFWRIDARIEKKWTLTKTTWIAFVLEVLNATLNKEVVRGQEIGPVTVPSIGLEGGF